MRKKSMFIVIAATSIILTGCATVQSPVAGWISTNVRASHPSISARPPETETYTKVGTATCSSFLGLFAWGDSSLETAMHNGRITKVHHVDYKSHGLLGLFSEYTLIVYGE